jgi:hypothetical protein
MSTSAILTMTRAADRARRNRYQVQAHLPLPEPGTGAPAIGDVLAVLLGDSGGIPGSDRATDESTPPEA